jgi:hypothetical protein
MPSFAVSICVLSVVQGALVGLPRSGAFAALERLWGPAWAIIPAGSVVAVVFGVRAAAGAAQGLTYLAVVAVPLLAAVALGHVVRRARSPLALTVAPLFAVAWADRSGLAGEAAAAVLTALSCVTLGALLEALAPARWLKVGIVVMAIVDTALVVFDQLQAPNNVLNAAAPAIGLPQLQEVAFSHAVMGYGDLFIAAVLGALLAHDGELQRRGAVLAVSLSLLFNLLFLIVNELPATVPVALTLIVLELGHERRRRTAGAPRDGRLSRRRPRPSRTARDPAAWARRAPR